MAIALIDLPETELIVRGKFPTRDETAFDRESAKFITAASCLTDAQTAVNTSTVYTLAEFLGGSGESMATKLDGHHETFGQDERALTATETWLRIAAENVRTTKNAINSAVTRYDKAYAAKVAEANDNSWPQDFLRQAKDDLVQEAQGEVDTLWHAYQTRHEAIREGIVAAADAPQNLASVPVGPPATSQS